MGRGSETSHEYTSLYIYFYAARNSILETYKNLQNDLTDKDILPLAKVVRLLPKGKHRFSPVHRSFNLMKR